MSAITVFSNESALVHYEDSKGRSLAISAEGAIIKGGKVLMSLIRDAALESALTKAGNGKYRAAADVLSAAFPSIGKSAEKLLGTVWANKTNMATMIAAVLRAEPSDKGWNSKQTLARALARELADLPAFEDIVAKGEVIEA